ncbi:Leucine-zipper-like transcriptional regulator [Balamuthia mandrillaris]
MFVFGGIGQGGLPLNDLFCFNLEKSRWSKVALKEDSSCKAPPPLWGHSAVVHADCMYVFGGFGDYISNQLYRFDFESKRWSLLTTTTAEEHRKPPPRHLHVAIVQQDTMYIIAGFTGSRNLSDFFALSLRTKNTNKKEAEEAKLLEWRELPPPPFGKEGRRGHKVAILQLGDDKEAEARPLLYVHAGRVEKDAVDDLHVFDFEKEKWFVVQSRTDEEEREKPTARYFHSMVEWRSSLWVFGGLGYDSSEAERKVDLNDFYQFHPERRLLEVGWVKEVARRHESVFLVVLSFIIFLLAFFVFSLRTI